MKKILILSLFTALCVACADTNELVEKPVLSTAQKISSFIARAQRENLSKEELDKRVNEFVIQLGGKLIPEAAENERSFFSGKEAGPKCQTGKWTNYQLDDYDSVGVLSFTGCTSLCPGSGDGYQISEWTWTGSKWNVKYTTVCTANLH